MWGGYLSGCVLPASAGMIRSSVSDDSIIVSAPRIRGDDPRQATEANDLNVCSPHPRG